MIYTSDLKLSSFCHISKSACIQGGILKPLFEEEIEYDLVNTPSAYTI